MSDDMPQWKRDALARFTEWLDAMPNEEPECQEPEPVDLYTLLEELTALKQEMRTLGRSTARLADSSLAVSHTLKDELPSLLRAQQASTGPDKEALLQARRQAERAFLIELGDLSVALNELRNREVDVAWPFYVSASVREQLVGAHAKPLAVLASRVDALLSRHGLSALVAVGDAFNAVKMNAAGISNAGKIAPGCISAVVKQGFVCGDDVLRLAEVIVEEMKK